MLKQTLFFTEPSHLAIKHKQLEITSKLSGEVVTRSPEDLGMVVFEHRQLTFTQQVMAELAKYSVAVVHCNEKNMPCAFMLPLDTHHIQTVIFRTQIEASKALKKQLWKQIIQAKITNQRLLLQYLGKPYQQLPNPKGIRTGDLGNQEAQAARIYWKLLFGASFKRERKGATPNNMLNYGYAILRATTARTIAGAGLLPMIGIYHHNKVQIAFVWRMILWSPIDL